MSLTCCSRMQTARIPSSDLGVQHFMQSFDLVETDFLTTRPFPRLGGRGAVDDSALTPTQVLRQRLPVKSIFAWSGLDFTLQFLNADTRPPRCHRRRQDRAV